MSQTVASRNSLIQKKKYKGIVYKRRISLDCDEAQEAVALNAGAALWVAGRVNSLQEGSSLAKEILRSGLGGEVLQRTQRFCRQLREVVV